MMSSNFIRNAVILSLRVNSLNKKITSSLFNTREIHTKHILLPTLSSVNFQARSMATKSSDLTYADITELQQKKEILLIDVRNPDEVMEGSIPGSFNVPLGELESALQLDDKDFETKYNHSKPHKDAPVVFSCRSGNRSRRAMELAQKLGFQKVKHYAGGWLDWIEKTKQ